MRHLTDHAKGDLVDEDGCYHLAKASWRSLAALQVFLEGLEGGEWKRIWKGEIRGDELIKKLK